MNLKNYIGHPLQIRGVETVYLSGGRGDGMKYVIARNGKGLELWIALDRCADLTRVTFRGENMGYLSPCGHVSPQYYDGTGDGFLKSFTGGFFTTAGLRAVGSSCVDEGEALPLHGTIANTPVETYSVEERDDGLFLRAKIRDCVIFGAKLVLTRNYFLSYTENMLTVTDLVENEGDQTTPFSLLYHCNMGYPLLSERSEVVIPHLSCTPRNAHAGDYLSTAMQMEIPQANYEERCYYFDVKTDSHGTASAGIFNCELPAGVVLSYDKDALPYFTEWKMMGKKDYVLGLEPGNCTPDGRDVLRREGRLRFLSPDERAEIAVTFRFYDDIDAFHKAFPDDAAHSEPNQ